MANNTVSLQLHAAATAAWELMSAGIHAPNAEEITKKAHGELWPIGRSDVVWVMRHLAQIRDILMEEHDIHVCLVNKEYYKTFKRKVPSTVEQAKLVIPRRGSFVACGLHLVVSENDTIYLAYQDKRIDTSVGTVNRIRSNDQWAIRKNIISLKNGKERIQTLKDKL